MADQPPTWKLHLLSKRQYEVVDHLVMGYRTHEIARLLAISQEAVHKHINAASKRIGGVLVRPEREKFREKVIRCVAWRCKQLGVIEHYAGLRDQWGVRLDEFELPKYLPMHPNHHHLFPERKIG